MTFKLDKLDFINYLVCVLMLLTLSAQCLEAGPP